MPPRRDGVKHVRVVWGTDVAACGERGGHLRFTPSLRTATCADCRTRREANIAVRRQKGNLRTACGY